MVDMVVWVIAISVIILSVINKDSTPANIVFCCFIIGALGLFTYQIIFGEKVPSSYYGYLSFSSFVAVVAVLLFSLSRILKIKELKAVGMSTISFWLVTMGLICLAHRYWGYGYISYFHLVLLLACVMFFVSEKWGSITVFKVLAILLANISFFYLVSVAAKLENGINYSNLTQVVVMESGIIVTCILFFSYYLLEHDIISEKHANRFLGVGVSLMAAGTVYLHPEASVITFKPFQHLKGLLAMGDLSAVAYGVGITIFAKTRMV